MIIFAFSTLSSCQRKFSSECVLRWFTSKYWILQRHWYLWKGSFLWWISLICLIMLENGCLWEGWKV